MPYPGEHSCRLIEPIKGAPTKRKNGDREHNGKKYDVIYQQQKGKWEDQAFRYPKETWKADEARNHCKSHNGILFEPASDAKEGMMDTGNTIMIGAFTHNSTVADNEPDWGSVDKTKLPRAAFADQGEPDKKSTWGYPHHWVKDGSGEDENGVYTTGTMYLHRGGLGAAWAAANGARGGEKAKKSVLDHLDSHRKAIGMGEENQKKKGDQSTMEIVTKESLRAAYPDVLSEIETEAFDKGHTEGLAKGRIEGAETERIRIKDVESQSIPGHEALIESLKYDGKTTGPEAAVKILNAEKAIRSNMKDRIISDRIDPIRQPAPPVGGGDGVDPNLPVEERAKQKWDKDPVIREEFRQNFASYLAFLRQEEAGNVRILKKG
jgi:hypothetical protein